MRKVTEDFIGTCQACFGEYKVNEASKLIVFHGYQRPGHGYTVGECPGTGHKPFEYDTKVTIQIIASHLFASDRAGQRKLALEEGRVTKLIRQWQEYDKASHQTVTKHEEIGTDSEHWDRTLKIAIANAESEDIYHTRVAAYLQAKVDTWELGQIIGIDLPATGKERALRSAYDPAEADAAAARAAVQAARDAKPGKLRVMFYREVTGKKSFDEAGGTEAAWREQYDRHEAAYAEWVATMKQWCKANFVGKTIVRTEYDFNLPRDIQRKRGEGGVQQEVVTALLPWDYRDWIKDRFPNAVLRVDAKKEVEYVVHLDKESI
jgi:hypothetical protein